jgi:broad specificity phosphatase PhoE
MDTQYVYLVRHGETEANKHERVQGFDEELSADGRQQAVRLAERCVHLSFNTLIASDMVRAKQTAEAIALLTQKEIMFEPLFREVSRPAVFEGASRLSSAYQAFLADEKNHVDDPNWQFEGGEYFTQLSKRAMDALTFLESYGADPLVVVSHGLFIKYVTATVLLQA